MANKVLFLDRDGTINVDKSYINRLEDLELIPQTREALQNAKKNGFLLALITNQAGIAKKLTPPDMPLRIVKEIEKFCDIKFDDVRICPHRPEDQCRCRKPGTKNLELSIEKLQADIQRSFFIGDHMRDLETAHRLGIKSILVLTGHGTQTEKDLKQQKAIQPYFVARNLFEAIDHIQK